MSKKFSLVIFTDLDGSLLHRDTFKFDEIKDYLKDLISQNIYIIPTTSKTEKEILEFNKELDLNLPFISENGSAISGLDIINSDLPKELILSREKEILIKIFEKEVPEDLKIKCRWVWQMKEGNQSKILGLTNSKLKNAMERKYTAPFIFDGNKNKKSELIKILKSKNISLQEGGRVINLTDKVSKSKSMNIFMRFFKRNNKNVKTIAVGDNFNDLDMLKNSDIPCLVFNDQFKQEQINIDNLIISNKPSPEGWADVIKKALAKLNYND